jgi:hypothetical protein
MVRWSLPMHYSPARGTQIIVSHRPAMILFPLPQAARR